jgi:monofunctional biosynthetic peptidoglycan transglycosylase
LIRAAMAGEDARFCRHHGFDWGAVATAWDRSGRLARADSAGSRTVRS